MCFRQSQELLKSEDFVWAVQLFPTKYVSLNLLCRANAGWQFRIAAATVLLLPFLAPDLLLWTCIGCLCGQPFLPCCDHMSAHIFSNQRACRDRDKKNRIPWVQGRGTQPDSSAWKVHSSFLTEIQLCVTLERVAFLIVDFSFHGQGHLLQVRPQPLYSGGFVYLGIHHSSLANCTGASIANVVARYQNSSSKLCLSLGSFEPRSLQQTRLHKNYNFGTAMNYPGLEWS